MQPQESPSQPIIPPAQTAPESPSTQARFQRYLPWLLILGAIWVAIGRGFFGVGGWGGLVTMLFLGPFLLAYSIAVSITLHAKSKRGYVMGKWAKWAFAALLVCIFAFGFFMVDGGDTRESVRSVFTSLFGVSQASAGNFGPTPPLLQISQTLTSVSFDVGALLLILALVAVSIDKNGEKPKAQSTPIGQKDDELPETPLEASQSRRWQRVIIVLDVLLIVGIAVYYLSMIWISGQVDPGASGTEFIFLAVFSLLAPVIALIALSTLIVSLLYIFRSKPRGKALVLGVLSLILAAYPASGLGYIAADQAVQTYQDEQQIAEERVENIQKEEQEKQRLKDMWSVISKDEATQLLQSCKVDILYVGVTDLYDEEPGPWAEQSTSGVVINKPVAGSTVTMGITKSLANELEPIARERAQKAECHMQLRNSEFTEGL